MNGQDLGAGSQIEVGGPRAGKGLVYSEGGRGGPGVAVEPTGKGDGTKTLVKWKTKPIPEGYSSPIIKSVVIAAGPKFELLATNDPGDPSKAAAVAGERIYIKGGKNLYCIGNK